MTILVTGGCGFIGSNFIKMFMDKYPDETVVNLDLLTYAGNVENLKGYSDRPNYVFYQGDICCDTLVPKLIFEYQPRAVINFAAESHVDRSIENSTPFIQTNVIGTANLLEAVKNFSNNPGMIFLHISTDEVYGSLSMTDEASTEKSLYAPRSPYAASKAASDHLAMSYYHTHGVPVIVTNCSNNYGPNQYPEKFLPVIITKAMQDKPIPLYGTGENVRDWLHVSDHCRALLLILERGRVGEKYNIGGDVHITNLEFSKMILDYMKKPQSLIQRVPDRKGHDLRYDIDSSKLKKELGWKQLVKLEDGLKDTIKWYQLNYGSKLE